MPAPFFKRPQVFPQSLCTAKEAVNQGAAGVIPAPGPVYYPAAEACFKAVKPSHGVGGVVVGRDAEEVVFLTARGFGVFHGFCLKSVRGHKAAFFA